jgi:hypothetical protein
VELPALKRPFFSENPKHEQLWIEILLAIAAVAGLILIMAWPQTRSLELIAALQQWRSAACRTTLQGYYLYRRRSVFYDLFWHY